MKTADKMVSTVSIAIVDAFTFEEDRAHTGNPASVVITEYDDDISDEMKSQIAVSMNQSMTAFVSNGWCRSHYDSNNNSHKGKDNDENFDESSVLQKTIRWFSPSSKECTLCGHATVAAAKAIINSIEPEQLEKFRKIEFTSKFRGGLSATLRPSPSIDDKDAKAQLITLDFPANRTIPVPLDCPWLRPFFTKLFGPKFNYPDDQSHDNDVMSFVRDVQFCAAEGNMLVIIGQKDEGGHQSLSPFSFIKRIEPDFDYLNRLSVHPEESGGMELKVVTVTIRGEGKVGEVTSDRPHIYTRVFAPYYGVNEDPACGSAHTIAAPYWMKKLGMSQHDFLRARHASARGGELVCQHVVNSGGDGVSRVTLGSRARIFLQGQLTL